MSTKSHDLSYMGFCAFRFLENTLSNHALPILKYTLESCSRGMSQYVFSKTIKDNIVMEMIV